MKISRMIALIATSLLAETRACPYLQGTMNLETESDYHNTYKYKSEKPRERQLFSWLNGSDADCGFILRLLNLCPSPARITPPAPIAPISTSAPITEFPSQAPITPIPTSAPILSDTQAPIPTQAPTASPFTAAPITMIPTQALIAPRPNSAPITAISTQAPIAAIQTQAPTVSPTAILNPATTAPIQTQAPVVSPSTMAAMIPTQAPIAPIPTQSLVTPNPISIPTQAPTTAIPTQAPTVPPSTPAPTASPTILPISPAPVTSPINVPLLISSAKQHIVNLMNPTFAASLIRLSFHDCVGGCDGCVDVSNPANFGLQGTIESLQPIVDKFSGSLTRADIWVLAGLTAAEESLPSGVVLPFDMTFIGRPVCDNALRGPDRVLPDTSITTNDLLDFFQTNFGFDDVDTTAIMGAHTLGRALPENSGFDGQQGWTFTPGTLDNAFYRALLTIPPGVAYRQQRQPNGKSLWRRISGELFAFNADMALVFNFHGLMNPQTEDVSCDLTFSCLLSPLLDQALAYRDDENLWLRDFRVAFVRMTNTGCSLAACTPV